MDDFLLFNFYTKLSVRTVILLNKNHILRLRKSITSRDILRNKLQDYR